MDLPNISYNAFFRYPKKRQISMAHFNSATGTQMLTSVVNAMNSFVNQNHYGDYSQSAVIPLINIQYAHNFVCTLVGAESTCSVSFNTSIKQLVINCINNLIYEYTHMPINHVVISHRTEAYMDVPQSVYNYIDLWEDDDVESLKGMLTPETRVLMISHVCHMTGKVFDVKHIIQTAREQCNNLFVIVDGSLFVPHHKVNFEDIGADMYIFTFKRMYGPHIAAAVLQRFSNITVTDNPDGPTDCHTLSVCGVAHFIKTLRPQYATSYGITSTDIDVFYNIITKTEQHVLEYLTERIQKEMHGFCTIIREDHSEHVPILGLHFTYKNHREVAIFLNECNITCDHVQNEFIPDESRDLIRLSLAVYNSSNDVDYVMGVIKDLCHPLAKSRSYSQLLNQLIYGNNNMSSTKIKILTEEILYLLFDEIHKDTYNDYPFDLYRMYGIVYLPMFSIVGKGRYLPHREGNTAIAKPSDICYHYPPNIINLSITKTILSCFAEKIYLTTKHYIRYLYLHQIRLIVTYDNPINTMKSFFDESDFISAHKYVGLILVNANNLTMNRISIKKTNDEQHLWFQTGDLIVVDTTDAEIEFSNVEILLPAAGEGTLDFLVLLSIF